jgi:putative redox protein
LLIMHSPTDDTVGIDNATNIFVAAKHPRLLFRCRARIICYPASADGALCRRRHRRMGRALSRARRRSRSPRERGAAQRRGARNPHGKFQQIGDTGPHQMLADEPRCRRRGQRARAV